MSEEYDVTIFFLYSNPNIMSETIPYLQELLVETNNNGGSHNITPILIGNSGTMVIVETWTPSKEEREKLAERRNAIAAYLAQDVPWGER